ncbi:hypothetical protein [Marinobacter sp. X15-166B]|uniref:hypothetical protein n=1 Tax=Marinobacter sp. X15-166B TaxID=1897620 RepID=UPI00085BFB0D|nr:hypothetical protein [Marinobacter sp. X15-166B]OEY66740.1 hypothetical protein BG841_09940 [Marinobacter sp. X15-166B]
MWSNGKLVLQVYTTYHSQNAWAHVQGVGWRKIRTSAADGVTNTFCLLSTAQANNRTVNVYVVNNLIERAYMN